MIRPLPSGIAPHAEAITNPNQSGQFHQFTMIQANKCKAPSSNQHLQTLSDHYNHPYAEIPTQNQTQYIPGSQPTMHHQVAATRIAKLSKYVNDVPFDGHKSVV